MYREEIKFFSKSFYFVLVVLILIVLYIGRTDTLIHTIPVIIVAVLLPLLFGRLLITVKNHTVSISFGFLGLFHKEIPVSDIKEARVVEYKPLRQFGGWGIKSGKLNGEKTACYTMKGNSGVLLTLNRDIKVCLTKTNKLLIGSLTPEKLKRSLGK